MTLHCGSRLGILSYIYQQRHDIAYTIGLISEIPIALCSSDYDFNEGLPVVHQDTSDQSIPPFFSNAHEILLFVQQHDFALNIERNAIADTSNIYVKNRKYTAPLPAIFHPPSLA
ncbi:hypothetical protein [Ohtaekwangia koreensis]|uniref:Uncharacterized protein n=1 Tax=Ohtaekwangia koreensis TaxID=688867 RepID=A0A1T5IRA2_9BACT|nr:hypothetical protein [Ohtaekwangia koreensis]SKC41666.1 hypothetical protein SAMN05660236_0305 [Ohtaekwangia koreensis]